MHHGNNETCECSNRASTHGDGNTILPCEGRTHSCTGNDSNEVKQQEHCDVPNYTDG